LHLRSVPRVVLTVEDTPEELWVEGLDPAPQDGGIARDLLHGDNLDPQDADKDFGAPCRIEGHPQLVKFFYQGLQALFVKYGNQCGCGFFGSLHVSLDIQFSKATKVLFLRLKAAGISNKSTLVFKNLGHFGVDGFQKAFILLPKGIWGVGIDVDLSDVFPLDKEGDHDLCLDR